MKALAVPAPIMLAGATASGKSAVALALAGLVGGEIISVDSMQVYRGSTWEQPNRRPKNWRPSRIIWSMSWA